MKHKLIASLLAVGSLVAGHASAQTMRPDLDFHTAKTMQETCFAKAIEEGWTVAIAIYDRAANLVLFARMDDSSASVGDLAQWKGKSAAAYRFASADTANWSGPGAPDIATFGGGLPLFTSDGDAIGGVGVSGAESDEDEACGRAGAQAVGLIAHRPN